MSVQKPKSRPHFTRPPVREVLLGIQFEPIPWLGPFDLGDLIKVVASTAGPSWGPVEVRNAVGQISLGSARAWEAVAVNADQLLRAVLRRSDGTRLIQLENGWLTMSWVHQENQEQYPHYEFLVDEFARLLASLQDGITAIASHLSSDTSREVRPNFFEFTYVNAIPVKPDWTSVRGWHEWVPGIAASFPHLEGASNSDCIIRTTAQYPELGGQVESILEPKLRRTAQAELRYLQLRITAQGAIQNANTWRDSMDSGHDIAARTFNQLLSDKARQEFGYASN